MMTRNRIGGLLASVAMIAAACSSAATPSPSAAPPSVAPSSSAPASASASVAPASSAPASLSGTINIWEAYGASGTSERDAFNTILGFVKAANADLKVTPLDVPFGDLFNKFKTAAASGGGPDMYIAPNDDLTTEARAGLLKDLSSMQATLMAAPYNTSQTAITADTVDGKLYAIPESLKAVALFYNKSMLATPPASTADWLTNAKQLGWVYANPSGSYYLWGLFGSFGGKILDDSGKCAATAGGVADALAWLQQAKAAGMHFYKNDNDAKADMIAGKIAGFIDGPWQTGDLKAALKDNLAVAPGPTGPGGAFQPMAAPDGYYINQASPNADLAVQVALQMLSQSNEQMFVDRAGHVPANTAIKVTDPITQGFATAIQTGFPRPTAAELNNYWGNFGNALVAAIDKGSDAKTLVAAACTAMDKANNK